MFFIKTIRLLIFILGTFFISTTLFCASGRTVVHMSFDIRKIMEADSLYHVENYTLALEKYSKIAMRSGNKDLRAKAGFLIGYLNIHYKNQEANRQRSLDAFKQFVADYPNDKRIDDANNWIRILTAMNVYDRTFHSKSDTLLFFSSINDSLLIEIDSIQTLYMGANILSDSLRLRIEILEGVIAELGKIR